MEPHSGVGGEMPRPTKLNEEIRRSLAKITLQDIVDKTRENSGDFLDYCI